MLVKFDPKPSRYNQGGGDRLSAGKDESLLGHCVEERGWTLEQAICNLRPIVKEEALSTAQAAQWSKVTAVAGFVVGLVGGGTLGALGMLPLAGAALAAYVWRSAESCTPRRDLEYNLLKVCPQIPEVMLSCYRRGAAPEVIIAAWDTLLDSYSDSEGANANLLVLEFARLLDHVGTMPSLPAATEQAPMAIQPALESISVARPELIAPKDGPLSVILANPYQNRLIFGGQRTGKSFLAAIATRYLASTGIKVYHLNLSHTRTSEGRDEDAEYWQHATASIRSDLGSLDSQKATQVTEKALKLVQDFWGQTGAILVVDEGPAQASTANLHRVLLEPLNAAIAAFSSQCNSTGVKRAKSVWTIGPEFVAGNMTQHGKSYCKTGSLTHVFIHPDSQSEWNGQRLVFDTGLFQQLSTNFQTAIRSPSEAEPCDRGAQIDGHFYSLDGLTLPDWNGQKCIAAQVDSEDHTVSEKVQTEPGSPVETVMQKIAAKVKEAGTEGVTGNAIKTTLSKSQREHFDPALKALLKHYPNRYFMDENKRICTRV